AIVPLERKPLMEAKRWLMVAVGRVANKDYNSVHNEPIGVYRLSGVRLRIGQGPAMCEPLQATATLRRLGTTDIRVVALTPQMTAKDEIRVTAIGDSVQIPLDKARSVWMLLESKKT
ncbi:MAG: hypothetical protein NZT92_05905, partial [Abditibacteriales bacterium]|nr:hypothetical protein [Abditibacteriales bacterium]MDW8364828.1 hypothetical protein [Abditibacteriales bacterium]